MTALVMAEEVAPKTLEDVVDTFQRWLYLPDELPLLSILGTVAANQIEGDPVWLLLVGPPGSGKSELLQAMGSLPNVHHIGTLTQAALLSGTKQKERAIDAKGGLLRAIGDFGIILAKDFGSVLSIHHDERARLMAALREIYDGSWVRDVGVDGGRKLHWRGKVGMVAGCTPTIDRHHAVMGAMGERFVMMRMRDVDEDERADRTLAHAGQEKRMRDELSRVVNGLFVSLPEAEPLELKDEERQHLKNLASLVVRCRSAVERDNYTREIELVPPPEASTRLLLQLQRLFVGLDVIGVSRPKAWGVITRVGFDSMPILRRKVIEVLLAYPEAEIATTEIAERVDYPTSTTRRTLEDLAAHKVIRRFGKGSGKAHTWQISPWTAEKWDTNLSFPEKSVGTSSFPENALHGEEREVYREGKRSLTDSDFSGIEDEEALWQLRLASSSTPSKEDDF